MKTKKVVREALYQRWLLNEFQLWQDVNSALFCVDLLDAVSKLHWNTAQQIVEKMVAEFSDEHSKAALEIVRDMIAEVANQ